MSANRNPFAHLQCAALSDVGRKRKNNEDSAASFPSRGVWCVADGMGGGDDGEIASGAVVRAVDACLADMPVPDDGDYSADTVVRCISRAIDGASAWIFDRAVKKGLDGCGSTVVGVAFDPTCPGTAVAFHVGDSRLYRLRGRDIRQITKDHSVEEMMGVKSGKSLNPMFRGMILRAVGIERSVEIEMTKFPISEGDVVLVCSDGLSRMLKDKEIAGIVRDAGDDMGVAASRLVNAANEAGGVDNITVVLVHVGALPSASAAADPPDNGNPESTETTGSVCENWEESGVISFLRKHAWHLAIVVLAALGGAVFAYFVAMAVSPKQDPLPLPGPTASPPPASVPVAKPKNEPLQPIAVVTNAPPSQNPVTSDVAKVEQAKPLVDISPKVDERTETETQEDRERQEALAQLKAERAHRAKEEAEAKAREDERLAVARELAACYYRDEFSAFARSANSLLEEGAAGKLQTLGRTLHMRMNKETVGEAAVEFMTEARSLAARIVAAAGSESGDVGMAEACRPVADGDPSAPATQRAFLDLLKRFSTQKAEGNGRTR